MNQYDDAIYEARELILAEANDLASFNDDHENPRCVSRAISREIKRLRCIAEQIGANLPPTPIVKGTPP